jgi:hypothetical protein
MQKPTPEDLNYALELSELLTRSDLQGVLSIYALKHNLNDNDLLQYVDRKNSL